MSISGDLGKSKVVCAFNGILFSFKMSESPDVFCNVGESEKRTEVNEPAKHMEGYASFNTRLLMSSLEAENRTMLLEAGKSGEEGIIFMEENCRWIFK